MEPQKFGRITFIPGMTGGKYPLCNSLYIDDDIRAIFDAGSDEFTLQDMVEEKGLDVLINTHYHEDHISYNYLFPDAALWVPGEEADCFSSMETFLRYFGVLGTDYEQVYTEMLVTEYNYQEREPALEFSGGEVIDFGHLKCEVLHTPGHTCGHLSFLFPDQGILFTGDLDLTDFGPYYGDAVSDIDQTITSVKRLADIGADITITSHEAGIIRGDIRKQAESYLAVIDSRDSSILEFLDRPRTREDIIDQWLIYRRPRGPVGFYSFLERNMIGRHLERLLRAGQIIETEEGFIRI